MTRKVVVGLSGGVTSAWCLDWALRTFPRDEVIALFHDTKEEHPDTYRFLYEIAARLGIEVTERSDGRSVTELFRDEGYLGNNQQTFCSRILKAEQGSAFIAQLKHDDGGWRGARAIAAAYDPHGDGIDEVDPVEILKVIGYAANEPKRVARMVGHCAAEGVTPRFPIIEERVTKQQCADRVQCDLGVRPSAMYLWADHANCLGCVKGGRAYFLALHEHHPDVFEQRAQLEEEFGHEIIRGGDRERVTLRQLLIVGLRRKVGQRERIEIGACECGDGGAGDENLDPGPNDLAYEDIA